MLAPGQAPAATRVAPAAPRGAERSLAGSVSCRATPRHRAGLNLGGRHSQHLRSARSRSGESAAPQFGPAASCRMIVVLCVDARKACAASKGAGVRGGPRKSRMGCRTRACALRFEPTGVTRSCAMHAKQRLSSRGTPTRWCGRRWRPHQWLRRHGPATTSPFALGGSLAQRSLQCCQQA